MASLELLKLWLHIYIIIWVIYQGLTCKDGTAENQPCLRCGENSRLVGKRMKCRCHDGYMRKLSEQNTYTAKCHSLKPQNMKLLRVAQNGTIRLTWDAVVQLDDEDVVYVVKKKIDSCSTFFKVVNTNEVILTNIKPNSLCLISVTTDSPVVRHIANTSRTSFVYFFTDNKNIVLSSSSVGARVESNTVVENRYAYADNAWITVTPPLLVLFIVFFMVNRMYKSKQRRRENSNKYFIMKSYQIDHEDSIIKQLIRMNFN